MTTTQTSSTPITTTTSTTIATQSTPTLTLQTTTTIITSSSTDVAPVSTAKVTVNTSGFNPDTIVIPVGTVVIWKSLEEENCSICHGSNDLGLNPHLFTHNISSDIDLGLTHTVVSDTGLFNGELPPRGIFVKYFSIPGTYTYHDSLHPELDGEIIVQ